MNDVKEFKEDVKFKDYVFEEEKETKWTKFRDDVSDFFYHTLKFRVITDNWYSFKYGIRNLIKWSPTIWKDRNWDAVYSYRILIKKLEMHRDALKRNNIYVGVEENIEQMEYTINLLKKANDEWENYELPFIEKHEAKWGKTDFEFKKVEEGKFAGNYEMITTRDRVLTPEEDELERKEYIEGLTKAHSDRMEDLANALENMAKNSDAWWD